MLATLVDKPFNNKDWVFEVKWDGIRSIFYFHKPKDILKLQSRNGIDITHRYPESGVTYSYTASHHGCIIPCHILGYCWCG